MRTGLAFLWLAACTPSSSPAKGTLQRGTGAGPAIAAAGGAASGSAAGSTMPTPTPLAPPAVPAHQGPLGAFYDALRELEHGRRKQHVRILWLGDSHAQADFWTGGVRTALQARFGAGGPGFVHLGMDNYRHHDVAIELQGSWRMRPKKPSGVDPWGDGAFGLGGILHAGYAGKRLAGIRVLDPNLSHKKLSWEICYKPSSDRDKLTLEIGDRRETLTVGAAGVGRIQHLSRETSGSHRVAVQVLDGRPDFCGVLVETDPATHPGVVLDNLGINGARYATALAWSEKAWADAVQRRSPELFVFEYGGNEAGDAVITPDEYEKQAKQLIVRAKRVRAEASCLVIGPTDRADRETSVPPIAEAMERAAAASGCTFWNSWAVMGGSGSLARWRDEKKAAADGIHLLPKGYAELAALLVQDLLAGYRKDPEHGQHAD